MTDMEVDGARATPPAETDGISLPWVEKYRPTQLSELCSHTEIIGTLNKLMGSGHLPNLLFYGPPGTGKTSTILACARQMYGKSTNSMVLELNASDDRCVWNATHMPSLHVLSSSSFPAAASSSRGDGSADSASQAATRAALRPLTPPARALSVPASLACVLE
jgi:hypothetical protein